MLLKTIAIFAVSLGFAVNAFSTPFQSSEINYEQFNGSYIIDQQSNVECPFYIDVMSNVDSITVKDAVPNCEDYDYGRSCVFLEFSQINEGVSKEKWHEDFRFYKNKRETVLSKNTIKYRFKLKDRFFLSPFWRTKRSIFHSMKLKKSKLVIVKHLKKDRFDEPKKIVCRYREFIEGRD